MLKKKHGTQEGKNQGCPGLTGARRQLAGWDLELDPAQGSANSLIEAQGKRQKQVRNKADLGQYCPGLEDVGLTVQSRLGGILRGEKVDGEPGWFEW